MLTTIPPARAKKEVIYIEAFKTPLYLRSWAAASVCPPDTITLYCNLPWKADLKALHHHDPEPYGF